jgi:hypothetical protein
MQWRISAWSHLRNIDVVGIGVFGAQNVEDEFVAALSFNLMRSPRRIESMGDVVHSSPLLMMVALLPRRAGRKSKHGYCNLKRHAGDVCRRMAQVAG